MSVTDSKPWAGRRLHFVGVGGCGMSGLALVARDLGATVTGSDRKESIFVDSLRASGVTGITIGHSADAVPEAGELVYSSAIPPDNIERMAGRARGLTESHRSALLAELTRMHATVAIAGAHGKTTTAALTAHVLTHAGKDPSYIVGGLLRPPGVHARAGAGGILVIEADESDRSLVNYKVDLPVITNVDLDHVGDAAGYRSVDDVVRVLADFARQGKETVLTRQAEALMRDHLDAFEVVLPQPTTEPPSTGFTLDGEAYEINQPGRHNIENAALAARVALRHGCTPAQVRAALLDFPGLARRFDLRGRTPAGARVYDDYAHHPTEVSAVLAAARTVSSGRVLAVFQPHLFSRTEQFREEFALALGAADLAYVEPIYPAREAPADWKHVSSQQIIDHATASGLRNVEYAPSRPTLADRLMREAGPDDVILLIGAGDVGAIADRLVP